MDGHLGLTDDDWRPDDAAEVAGSDLRVRGGEALEEQPARAAMHSQVVVIAKRLQDPVCDHADDVIRFRPAKIFVDDLELP